MVSGVRFQVSDLQLKDHRLSLIVKDLKLGCLRLGSWEAQRLASFLASQLPGFLLLAFELFA